MVRGNRRGKADKAEEIPAPAPAPSPKKSAAPKKAIKAKEEAAAEKVAEEAPKEVAVAPAPVVEPAKEETKPAAAVEETPEEDDPNAVWSPNDADVLSGRGASVNSHGGNKKFRALCFANKPQFEAGNHAAKRRIATEIVDNMFAGEARFLKRKSEKGPWTILSKDAAILKACQVMRDYKRPDRIAQRQMMAANGQVRKRVRQVESTPLPEGYVPPTEPLAPIVENPEGVHDHDILCGRGAFVNGHIGNQRLRKLAQERKKAFDVGNYTEKRSLANEIVTLIKALDPPGRFLRKGTKTTDEDLFKKETKEELKKREQESEWEELNDEKAIHKACQVMRDIDRPDRKDREERRLRKKQKIVEKVKPEDDKTKDQAVSEAVAATEEALDKALDAADSKAKPTEKAEV